jgi:hypothetical protein
LNCTRGDTAAWDVAVTDQAGVAVNLTGAVTYFTVRDQDALTQTADSDAALQVYSAAGISYTTPASGLMRITLSATQTRTLAVRAYLWDLQVKVGGSTQTPAKGLLLVTNEQTRTS